MPDLVCSGLSADRRNNFDVLRFALAALVIFSHSYSLLGRKGAEPILRLTHGRMDGGMLAVNGFFVLSGFLVAGSWTRSKGLGDYLKKRAFRIYPGFLAALLFCALVVTPLSGLNGSAALCQQAAYQFVSDTLLCRSVPRIPGAFASNSLPGHVNGSLWTIRFELLCYLLVAAGGLAGAHRRRVITLIAFAVVYVAHRACPQPFSLPYWGNVGEMPRLVTYFLAGMTFYFYQGRIRYSRLWLAVSCVFVMLAGYGAVDLILPIFGTYLLLYLAFSRAIRLENFAANGDFSYGVYLYGFPVQQLLARRFGHALEPTTLFLLAAPLSFALAYCSWHLIEKPFLKRKTTAEEPEITPEGKTKAGMRQAAWAIIDYQGRTNLSRTERENRDA